MASSSAENGVNLPPQYHHFIPRFLLKNFAVFKNPGKIKSKTGRGRNKTAPVPSRLNLLDLATGTLTQQDVARTFGFLDMYRDVTSSTSDPFDLEKRLSRLETDAGRIISDIKRAHDSGRGEVHLKRGEKDLLRRFLFIMLYRNTTLARRFEKSTEEYDANDKETMLEYMREHGFRTPRDVWFSNIRAFLEVDLSREWQECYPELHRRIYPSDAEWFFKNMQMSFLALCTPSTAEEEFILTQNAYSVFEGPQSPNGAWTDYHVFAPISPKLMMVTRSCLLPTNAAGESGEQERLEMLERSKSMHLDPSIANSILEDLPIAKAGNNYTVLVDGKLVLSQTKMSRDKHVFYFKFFPIQSEHVQKINMVLLEEALGTIAIIYKSPTALRRALEYYLPSEGLGFKRMVKKTDAGLPDHVPLNNGEALDTRRQENRLPYLLLLEKVAQTLGSTVTAKYTMIDSNWMEDPSSRIAKLRELLNKKNEVDTGNPKLEELYDKMGGSLVSVFIDSQQAELVLRLIGITDRIMKTLDNSLKEIIRKNREDLICSLPPRRVWLLVKNMRNWKSLEMQPPGLGRGVTASFEGVEDALAEGSIRDCGIPVFQEAIATSTQQYQAFKQIYPQGASERSFYQFLSEEQISEIWTRNAIEVAFEELLRDLLTVSEIEALKRVMFRHLYRSDFGGRVPGFREPDDGDLASILD